MCLTIESVVGILRLVCCVYVLRSFVVVMRGGGQLLFSGLLARLTEAADVQGCGASSLHLMRWR